MRYRDYHGLQNNFGDLRLFSIYLAICNHKVNPKNNGDRSDRSIVIAGGWREHAGRMAMTAAAYSEMGYNYFCISAVYGPIFKRFSAK